MIYDIQLSNVRRPDADFVRKIGAERAPVRVEFNIASKHGFDISKISVLVSVGDIDDSEIISVARHALHDLCTRLSEQTLPWKQEQSYFDEIRNHTTRQARSLDSGKALQ